MVWFQCEDCGENLKKPKLLGHFRMCSAFKLSCIDCGEMFGQESVQGHNQCITEAEKYGPKGPGKAPNGATPKSEKKTKQKPDVDINVGLSERPPWFCSLCNTKATSKQALLIHADGKKHRAKARAFHAKSAPNGNATNCELVDNKHVEEQEVQHTPKDGQKHDASETETVTLESKKKRKLDESMSGNGLVQKNGINGTNETGNAVLQVHKAKADDLESHLKKAKHDGVKDDKIVESVNKEDTNKKINLKKLIKSALKTNPDGALKMKKLKKLVLGSLQESDITKDETQLIDMLERKINSSSRFTVDNKKYVRLVGKD
ncbi:UBP1-associated proteins 1C [Euphorbia lathyris]|uniref:UBP1-associated proteins 1C n=1 Tax=Euphorbia lathyris TaxID=212925 RepID=UPI0033139043